VTRIYPSNLSCVNTLTNDTLQMVSVSHTLQGHNMFFMCRFFNVFFLFPLYLCVCFLEKIVYK
jgi:hypothetical protein